MAYFFSETLANVKKNPYLCDVIKNIYDMTYKGIELNTIGQVFEMALEIAKWHPEDAKDFLMEYARYIQNKNEQYISIYEAIAIAKSNFAYYSGYYSNYECKLIHKVYCNGI